MCMSVKTLVEKFLNWCVKNRRPRTEESYRYHLTKWLKTVGDRQITDMRPIDLTSWAESWHEYQAVQRLFQFAVEELEALQKNPFSKVKRPPMGERKRILSPAQMAAYAKRARPCFRRYLLALRATIARPQEIRAAEWNHLVPENPRESIADALPAGRALIVMNEYKSRSQRKDPNAPRVLLVNRRLGRMIARLMGGRTGMTGPIFRNEQGRGWSNNAVRCAMRRLRKHFPGMDRNGVEQVVCYSFRHSVATVAVAAGIRDRVLAELLGHTSTKTTARYQHLQVSHLREAMNRLEG